MSIVELCIYKINHTLFTNFELSKNKPDKHIFLIDKMLIN